MQSRGFHTNMQSRYSILFFLYMTWCGTSSAATCNTMHDHLFSLFFLFADACPTAAICTQHVAAHGLKACSVGFFSWRRMVLACVASSGAPPCSFLFFLVSGKTHLCLRAKHISEAKHIFAQIAARRCWPLQFYIQMIDTMTLYVDET